MNWCDNEDAGDCGMMNTADASEFFGDDDHMIGTCQQCGARLYEEDSEYGECSECGEPIED